MNWLSNEILFYGGIIVSACSLMAAIVVFFISKIKLAHLNSRLDEEYGKMSNK